MERRKALEAEWSPLNERPLEYFKEGSGYKAWWKHSCECGKLHEWQAVIGSRFLGCNCPICTGRGKMPICYCKSLQKLRPELMAEWHPKNKIKPSQIGVNSNKKVWWLCSKSECSHPHEWEALIFNRTRTNKASGCPFCSGHLVCPCNSLLYLRPEIAAEWHPKNKIGPQKVSVQSNKIFSWLCVKNNCSHPHEWESSVLNRTTHNSGCPYCSGHKFCPCDSLAAKYPELISEWSPKNQLGPTQVSVASHTKIIWRCYKHKGCDKIHEWKTSVKHRTLDQTGCPYCSGRKVCYCNSLAALNPKIAAEWSSKNKTVPSKVPIGSHVKYWWICSQDHDWLASITNRSRKNGTGCPICASSKGEKEVKRMLEQMKVNYISQKIFSYKNLKRLSFDFYFPDHNKAVEFDGIQHFQPVEFFGGEKSYQQQVICDLYKNEYCSENEISLLRIHYKDKEEIPFLLDSLLSEDDPAFQMFSASYP